MHYQEIDESNLLDQVKQDTELLYLLLDTDYFDDVWSAVCDIDFATGKRWLWENTQFDQHAQDGPLLVELDINSALLQYFIEHWADENAAILIKTPYDMESLIQHLRSLLIIQLPDGQAHWRWYEPRKLAHMLTIIEDTTLTSVLGPMQQITWCENCGRQQRWLQMTQTQANLPGYSQPWMHLSQQQLDKMNAYENEYFCRALTSEVKIDVGEPGSCQKITHISNPSEDTLYNIIKNGMKSAMKIGITDEESIKRYINACLYYPQILEHETSRSILNQTQVHGNARMNQIEFWIEQNLTQNKHSATA